MAIEIVETRINKKNKTFMIANFIGSIDTDERELEIGCTDSLLTPTSRKTMAALLPPYFALSAGNEH